jgi:hypothetical protein
MHYGTHLREAFCDWLDEGCPPLAAVEEDYRLTTWPSERLLRTMLRCSDMLPRSQHEAAIDMLRFDPGSSYGSVARAMLNR